MGNLQRKNIDLLRAYRQHSTKKSTIPVWAKMAIPPLVALLLFAGVFGYATLQTSKYKSKLRNAQEEIATLEANGTSEEIAEFENLVDSNQKRVKNLRGVVDNLATYPRLGKAAVDGITSACGNTVTLQNVTFNEMYGSIIIVAQTPYVYDTANFITRLKATGLFSNVNYTGYSLQQAAETETKTEATDKETTDEDKKEEQTANENTTAVSKTPEGVYEMNITCVLKAGV